MVITYGNYKIESEGLSFTLYFVDKGKDKLLGYFTDFKYVLKRLVHESKGPKQKNKADPELWALYKQYIISTNKLDRIRKLVYKPINVLDGKINGIRKV